MRTYVIVGIIISLFVPLGQAQIFKNESLTIQLDSVRNANQIPGIGVAIITSDSIQVACAGTIRVHGTMPVTLDHKWHLGSCTKAITSFIAMKLVEEDKISLTDRLSKVLPKLRRKMRKEYRKVTLFDLLSHRAGIQPYTQGIEFLMVPEFEGTMSEKRMEFARLVLRKAPVQPEEKGYVYSNAGFVLAALMLEKKTGRTWEELVAEVFRGMGWDYWVGFPNRENRYNPWGHIQISEDSIVEVAPEDDYALKDYLAPAGDLSLTLADYASFIQLNLRGLRGESNFLQSKSYEQLHFGRPNYALGWLNGTYSPGGERISTHDGSAGIYYCHTMLFPESDFAITILFNIANRNARAAIRPLSELLRSQVTKSAK